MGTTSQKEEIHRHSGWLIPGTLFFAILLLSGLLLGWYLRPGPRAASAPTGQSTLVKISLRGISLAIPANYIESSDRAGGEMAALTLAALLPSWHGYSDTEARLFAGNAPDSPVIRLTLRSDQNSLDARGRLDRIYMPHAANPNGEKGPFGLVRYGFTTDSGYEGNDLFVGETEKGPVLLLCERATAEFPSPNCLAVDRPLARNLSFSYRFKRAYLARWLEISRGVDVLIARFETNRVGLSRNSAGP
jgi:hypothetical protein